MRYNIQQYLDKIIGKIAKLSLKKVVLTGVALAVICVTVWFFSYFSVQETTVLGNVHYTEKEILAEVQKGFLGSNAFVVSHTKASFSPDDLELVDQIDVEMQDHHTLKITVQERQLIGYVQYLDCNLYFDSDGRVMNSVVQEEESEDEGDEQQALTAEAVGKTATSYVAAMKEAPLIQGLSFDSVTLHEILPVEDPSVFNTILGITRMINKYDITPDAVVFDEDLNVSLLYGEVTVELGQDLLMEEKLARVAAILPSIEGQSGVLYMSDYDGSSDNIVFSRSALSAESLDEE